VHEEDFPVVAGGRVGAALDARVVGDRQGRRIAVEEGRVAEAGGYVSAHRCLLILVRVAGALRAAGRGVRVLDELRPGLAADLLGDAAGHLPLSAAVVKRGVGGHAVLGVVGGVDGLRAVRQRPALGVLADVRSVERIVDEADHPGAVGNELCDGDVGFEAAPRAEIGGDRHVDVDEALIGEAHEHADAHHFARRGDQVRADPRRKSRSPWCGARRSPDERRWRWLPRCRCR